MLAEFFACPSSDPGDRRADARGAGYSAVRSPGASTRTCTAGALRRTRTAEAPAAISPERRERSSDVL
jgi:hypothetical protein